MCCRLHLLLSVRLLRAGGFSHFFHRWLNVSQKLFLYNELSRLPWDATRVGGDTYRETYSQKHCGLTCQSPHTEP